MGSKASHHLRGRQLHPVKHPGFKAVQAEIAAREGIASQAAGAILAASARDAAPAAVEANPRLRRVNR